MTVIQAIPASEIVDIIPRVIGGGGNGLGMNGMFLTDNAPCTSGDPVHSYSSPDDVGTAFGLMSEEYSLSVAYFLGYDNSFVKPEAMYFGFYDSTGTVAASLNVIVGQTQNFVNIVALDGLALSNANKEAIQTWVDGKGTRYCYVANTADAGCINPSSTTDLAYLLNASGKSGTCTNYGTSQLAAFVAGLCASRDMNSTNGAVAAAFKSQSGLYVTVDTAVAANALIAKRANFYGAYATANDMFKWFQTGSVTGQYLWVDTYWNAIWLNNALQLAIMSGFGAAGKTPYNAVGYARVRSWCQDPINTALNSGVIVSGVTLSQEQIAQVNSEAGFNIATTISTQGYYLLIQDASAQVRAQRGSPPAKLWYTDGGNIQKLTLASTVIL